MCDYVLGGFAYHVFNFLDSKSLWVRDISILWPLDTILGGLCGMVSRCLHVPRTLQASSCVYTYVMSTWAMPWAGTLPGIWRYSPRGWLAPMYEWMGYMYISIAPTRGLIGLCSLPIVLHFFSILLFLLTHVFSLSILVVGYPCNKRGVVSESVLRSRHSIKLN